MVTVFQQCHSQKTEPMVKPLEIKANSMKIDSDYLVGNWRNTATNFTTISGKEKQKLTNCELKSYWKFYKEKESIMHSKFTATDQDCNRYIHTTPGIVTLKNNEIIYFIDDVLYHQIINIESNQKFIIISRDFINGKHTTIEKVYEKK